MVIKPHLLLRTFCSRPHKTLFVTTPIFYVNAAPHIGHLYSAVIADAAFRYSKLRQNYENEILSTGTDEHGMKVAQAAAGQKVAVESYCRTISGEYKNVFDAANIKYTDYIRTTEERHKKSVAHFWNRLNERGSIYSTKYSGWYCVSDETFVTDSQVKETPSGKVSIESGHAVEWTEEVNYMFRLGNLQEDVLYWIKKGNRIKPQKFEKILLDLLSEPLPDVSISRPKHRMEWGIDVPNDESQKVYVWLDALVNYLTCAGYPDEQFKNRWPPTLQVLGKDILKFHGVYWPAFLIASGLEPPQQLLVHSHWTVDGQKMSKSKFNVVDPIERAQLFTMEGLRYFLLREGVVHSDGNYSNVKAIRILNSELADTLGNLLSRACANSLNPRQVFPIIHGTQFETIAKLDITQKLLEALSQTPDKCSEHYDSYNFYLVVDQIISVLHLANNFFETCKPWELKKANKTSDSSSIKSDDLQKLETIIGITMETLRVCGIILQPIIPGLTTQLLDKLSIPRDARKWRHLEPFLWNNINENKEKSLGAKNAVLFRRILMDNKEQKKKAAI